MSASDRPLQDYESVKTWFSSLREQSGVDPGADPQRLAWLKEFCEFVDLNPDEIVHACLLVKQGRETRISVKGRRNLAEKITEFQALGEGLDSRKRAARGNTIRSFLIHNGILLQAGMQI
jgi:hypothetical protein